MASSVIESLFTLMTDRSHELSRQIALALRRFPAARAYLLSYEEFSEVPLKGADRTQPPDVEKLLLHRQKAPSFEALIEALSR